MSQQLFAQAAPDPEDEAWRRQARCAGLNPTLFIDETTEAARVCQTCPVRAECRDYALDRPHLTGTWGGMTQAERRRLRRRDQRAARAQRTGKAQR